MFGGGITEIGLLLFLAFLVFGPKKLPEIARTLGKGMAELRRASNELKRSLEEEITNMDQPAQTSLPASRYGHDDTEPAREEPERRS